ncbi:EamA family transporter [Uliginosibacterium sediminicola]|uniref:EamA family transporter n=1 Tax=Uliginosibacterium sediminicola TaxID=2024550 RepID=A0ABU9YZU8_9RHOO
MHFVLLSALCSVLVSVLLKLARPYQVDVPQALCSNYLAASLLCALLLQPPLASLQQPGAPWPSLLMLAFVLPSLFLVLAHSVRTAGIVRTDVAQRLSLLLSLLAAFLWFGEQANPLKLAGLALGLLAVLGLLLRTRADQSVEPSSAAAWPALLTVWGGFALVDVLLKHIAAAGTPFGASLQLCFVLAFIGMALWQFWRVRRGQVKLSARSLGAGLLLGLINFGNIIFYVSAHRALPGQPAVVFASMNIGVVLLGTLVGMTLFGERLSWINRLAIVLALVSIAMIALSPRA